MDDLTFYVDIEDGSGVRQGAGPLTSVSSWEYTGRMDKAGSFRFTMAATDLQASTVTRKRVARARALLGGVWTEVGAGIIDSIVRQVDADGTVTIEVSGDDLTRELTYRSVLALRLYVGGLPVTHAAAVAAVAGYAPPGWTIVEDASPPNDAIYGRFNYETVLQALIKVADKSQIHFYRSTDRTLRFASSFTPSGVRAIQAGPGDLAAETCAITDLQVVEVSHELVTRIYPRGSGNGDVQLTLLATTRSAPAGYTLSKANNYIESNAATAAYGLIEQVLEYKEIGPIANTAADVQAAANALFDAALAELTRRSVEAATPLYEVSLAGCSALLRPMQTLRVVYRDLDAGLDINADLNILEAAWRVDGTGVQTTALKVTAGERWPQDDAGLLGDTIAQGRVYQALPQLNANEYVTAYTKHVDKDNTAVFRFRFSHAVTQLQQVLFEFQLLPFESTVKSISGVTGTSSSGGSSTPSSAASGDHTHTVTIAAHTHTVTVPGHGHTVTIAAHTHTVTIAAHTHTVTIPAHSHTVTLSNHSHTVTIAAHTHTTPNHQHHFAITLGATVSYPVGYGAAGTSGGLVSTLSGGTHDYPTNSSEGGATSGNGGSSTPTSSDGGAATPTSNTTSDVLNSSSQQAQTTPASSQKAQTTPSSSELAQATPTSNTVADAAVSSTQQSQTTPTSSSGGSHTHTVTVAAHTHTLTPVVTTIYGIFREALSNTYSLADLAYRVNGGGWAALSTAAAAGGGWYALDLTAAVQDATTLRPVQDDNLIEVQESQTPRSIESIQELGGNLWIYALDDGTMTPVVGGWIVIAGTVNYNGTYLVFDVSDLISPTRKLVKAYLAPAGAPSETVGTVTTVKTATLDAQLAVRTIIQSIAVIP